MLIKSRRRRGRGKEREGEEEEGRREEEKEEEVGKEEFTCKSKEINGKGRGKIANKEMMKKKPK